MKIKRHSHLPLQSFRLQAERSSTVVAFQLDGVVCCGEGGLSIGGCLKSDILTERKKKSKTSDDLQPTCLTVYTARAINEVRFTFHTWLVR